MRKGQVFTFWIGGLLVLVLSFGITLWLTEPAVSPADKLKLLAASAISDQVTLSAAADTAGLRHSSNVKGHVDAVTRLDATHVGIGGWAADTMATASNGAPVTVMAFSGGRNVLSLQTQGQRPDVASAFSLSDKAARDVAFNGRLQCIAGQKLMVVAATLSGTYALFGTVNCP